MKVVLLGSTGQLGQHFCRSFSGIIPVQREPWKLREALQAHVPQLVVNAAAYTAVDLAETEQEAALRSNGELPGLIALECERLAIPLVHFSTDYVFSGQGKSSWSEDDTCDPVNFYGASKLEGEKRVRQLCERSIIIRVSWLFGAVGKNFVRTILRLAEEREQLRVVDDQFGCPTWCGHIPAVVSGLLASQRWGTYHYCDQSAVSWWQFACEIVESARQMDWPLKVREILPIKTREFLTPAVRPACSVLDCTKLRCLGIEQGDWREGLVQTLQDLQREQAGTG